MFVVGTPNELPAHQFHFHRAIDTSDQRLIGCLRRTLIAHAASCMGTGMGMGMGWGILVRR